jgi:hypothetical protein
MTVQPSATFDGYDFVDFGCSSGGSMQFAKHKLGGSRGVGLDIDQNKVDASRRAGFDAHVADVTAIDANSTGTVRFVTMMHFLEHLYTLEMAEKCIRSACSIADEFVFIRQPFFDADDYLAEFGLRLYWSHWHGHRNHMTAADFQRILEDLLSQGQIRRFILFNRTKITDSDDPCVHPLSSPINQHQWEAGKHAPKDYHEFDTGVYREVGAIIQTRAPKLDEKPLRLLLSCEVFCDMACA